MIVSSGGGASVYGTGGNGFPPYYIPPAKRSGSFQRTHAPSFNESPFNRNLLDHSDELH